MKLPDVEPVAGEQQNHYAFWERVRDLWSSFLSAFGGDVIPGSVSDPGEASLLALDVGQRFGSVTLAPLGTGASDIARLEAVKTAVGGRYPIVCQRGTWYNAVPAVIDMPSNPWLYQAAWYINATTGNDLTGDGSNAAPIKTWAELRRRMGKGTVRTIQTITLQTDLTEDIIIDWQCSGEYEKANYILIYGTRTTVRSGTVAAVVDWNPRNATYGYFTDAAIADWTTHKDHAFMITSAGARQYCLGHMIAAVGGAVDRCRFQPMYSFNTGEPDFMPVAGDVYSEYTYTKITGRVEILTRGVVQFIYAEIDNSANPTANVFENTDGGTLLLTGCIVRGGVSTQRGGYWQFAGCHLVYSALGHQVMGGGMFDNWGNWWEGCVFSVVQGSLCDNEGDTVITGTAGKSYIVCDAGGHFRMSPPGANQEHWICWCDVAGQAIFASNGSHLDLTRQLWGALTGAPASAIEATKGCELYFDSTYFPRITGATAAYKIGATTYTDATIPTATYGVGCLSRAVDFWSLVGCTERGAGAGIEKSVGAGGWNAGGISVPGLSGAGSLKVTAHANNTDYAICLSHTTNVAHNFADIEFGWYFDNGNLAQEYESGVAPAGGTHEAFANGDIFEVRTTAGGVVTYWKNGVLKYTSLAALTLPAYVQADINTAAGPTAYIAGVALG